MRTIYHCGGEAQKPSIGWALLGISVKNLRRPSLILVGSPARRHVLQIQSVFQALTASANFSSVRGRLGLEELSEGMEPWGHRKLVRTQESCLTCRLEGPGCLHRAFGSIELTLDRFRDGPFRADQRWREERQKMTFYRKCRPHQCRLASRGKTRQPISWIAQGLRSA